MFLIVLSWAGRLWRLINSCYEEKDIVTRNAILNWKGLRDFTTSSLPQERYPSSHIRTYFTPVRTDELWKRNNVFFFTSWKHFYRQMVVTYKFFAVLVSLSVWKVNVSSSLNRNVILLIFLGLGAKLKELSLRTDCWIYKKTFFVWKIVCKWKFNGRTPSPNLI